MDDAAAATGNERHPILQWQKHEVIVKKMNEVGDDQADQFLYTTVK